MCSVAEKVRTYINCVSANIAKALNNHHLPLHTRSHPQL